MKQSFSKYARGSWIISSMLVLLPMAASANDCARMERLGSEWGANLSTFDSAKQRYFALSTTQQVPARCDYWKSYLHYLQSAKKMVDEYDRNTCSGKFSKIECSSACFAARVQDAEKQTQRACSPDSVARAKACAVAVDKYVTGHDVLLKKRREMTSRSAELEFEKKNKAAATKVDCERLKWDWTTYQPFLRRELKAVEDTCGEELFDFFFADRKTFRGSEYFTHTQPATTRQELADLCRIDASTLAPTPTVATPTVRIEPPKVTTPAPSPVRTETPNVAAPSPVTTPIPGLSRPTTSASCSDITGTNSAGPARQCATARKALQAARDDRTKYPQRAAKRYQEATTAYRQAGDQPRVALAVRESTASDPAPFIAAEAELAQRTKNIEEAENNARIARNIEEGAFESGSCADLQRAADYYLDAAKAFLRADQFAVVNAVLLRKDHLERLVDEAKRKGLCNRRLLARRTVALTSPSPEWHMPADQCSTILDHIRRAPDLQQGGTGAALMVELAAKSCKEPNGPPLTASQCQLASVTWSVRDVGMEEIDRRLKAAHCPCEVRGGEVHCDRARPTTASTSQPTAPTSSTVQKPAAKTTAPAGDNHDWARWLWQNQDGK